MLQGRSGSGFSEEIAVREIFIVRGGPGAATTFKKPHAGDVLEDARGAENAAFVGEIQAQGFVADDGLGGFGAEQRPRAGAEERGASSGVHGGEGGAGVMTGGRDDDGARECACGGARG